ncbi:hypothetical protein [Pseudalkalibacillus berkeleyi]|uniref:Uncharacterized protein n=1 Tax=Pseudalkalibacillus berkeleyi TaxID=1069813 RepID=A0ABS9H3K0_9BACL|nr:hypothetical protein [Pseudalkalibacillus berkeleyi]MCF6138656.1 hypothetical protein [Pseudalkalibacillus berkeleyi]
MIADLNNQIIQIKGDIRKKHKWEVQLKEYKREYQEMHERVFNLNDQLTAEKADVDKIEGISVTSLLLTILGTKEGRLDEEKQDVAAVQLKLDEAKKSREEVNQSINDLQKKLIQVKDAERKYEQLLSAKEKYIKESGSPVSSEIYRLSEQEGDLSAFLNELSEAIHAGNAVIHALDQALHSLEKANNWGTLDMLGGGMISSAVKHNHIDDATGHIHHAQTKMRTFQKELIDVNEEADLNVDVSSLLKFADFFFDGLISDWMVQGRINDSLDKTRTQKNNIDRLLSKLQTQADQTQNRLQMIKNEKQNLIESA